MRAIPGITLSHTPSVFSTAREQETAEESLGQEAWSRPRRPTEGWCYRPGREGTMTKLNLIGEWGRWQSWASQSAGGT